MLALAFALLLGAIVVAADRGALPVVVYRLYAFPGGDKVGHAALMGAFAFLASLALPRPLPRAGPVGLPAGAWVVAVLVTLEEISQHRFPGRTPSLTDLAASYAGIVVGALAARRVGRARRRGERARRAA